MSFETFVFDLFGDDPIPHASEDDFCRYVIPTLLLSERDYIRLRYGIGGIRSYKLREIAEILGVTPGRVHGIWRDLKRKLHNPQHIFRNTELLNRPDDVISLRTVVLNLIHDYELMLAGNPPKQHLAYYQAKAVVITKS